jgi:hypothetical protein
LTVENIVPVPSVEVSIPPALPPTIENHLPAPVVRIDAPVTVQLPSPVPLKVERARRRRRSFRRYNRTRRWCSARRP